MKSSIPIDIGHSRIPNSNEEADVVEMIREFFKSHSY